MSAKDVLKKYEIEVNKTNFEILTPLISNDCKFWFTSGTQWRIIHEHLGNFPKLT